MTEHEELCRRASETETIRRIEAAARGPHMSADGTYALNAVQVLKQRIAELKDELRAAQDSAKRYEMICAIVRPGLWSSEDLRRVIDARSASDLQTPCEDCSGPLLDGDGKFCEWCGSNIPTPQQQAPERFEQRRMSPK